MEDHAQDLPPSGLTIRLPPWAAALQQRGGVFETDLARVELAIELSRQNVRNGTGGPFGAAVFEAESGALVSVGVNMVVPSGNAILHAETVAIMLAQQRCGSHDLGQGGARRILAASCEPCAMCLGAVLWSGVSTLLCGASGDMARAVGFNEGPVFDASWASLLDAGIDIRRGLASDSARQVLEHYRDSGGLIYNGGGR